MALTFDATPKGADSNSYILVTDADDYFDGQLFAETWASKSTPEKEQALVAATSRLEMESYRGVRTTSSQRLKWPRADVAKDDGNFWDSDVIPRPVQEAAAQQALDMLNETEDPLAASGLEPFESVRVGSIAVTIDKQTYAGQLSSRIVSMLADFFLGGLGTVRLVRS